MSHTRVAGNAQIDILVDETVNVFSGIKKWHHIQNMECSSDHIVVVFLRR
jgi:hypothetical protein